MVLSYWNWFLFWFLHYLLPAFSLSIPLLVVPASLIFLSDTRLSFFYCPLFVLYAIFFLTPLVLFFHYFFVSRFLFRFLFFCILFRFLSRFFFLIRFSFSFSFTLSLSFSFTLSLSLLSPQRRFLPNLSLLHPNTNLWLFFWVTAFIFIYYASSSLLQSGNVHSSLQLRQQKHLQAPSYSAPIYHTISCLPLSNYIHLIRLQDYITVDR